jgi:hypothetical protein
MKYNCSLSEGQQVSNIEKYDYISMKHGGLHSYRSIVICERDIEWILDRFAATAICCYNLRKEAKWRFL